MLTRRQLLGGLAAYIPFVGVSNTENETIAKVAAEYVPERALVNIISIKETKTVIAEYENQEQIEIPWRAGSKFELLAIYFTADKKIDIDIFERVNLKLNTRVRIINVNLSDFNIETCSTSSIDWSQINKENNLNYGKV